MFEEISPIEATITIFGKPSKEVIENYRSKRFDILLKDVVFSSVSYSEIPFEKKTTYKCIGVREEKGKWLK